jgi:hypothetical protein
MVTVFIVGSSLLLRVEDRGFEDRFGESTAEFLLDLREEGGGDPGSISVIFCAISTGRREATYGLRSKLYMSSNKSVS